MEDTSNNNKETEFVVGRAKAAVKNPKPPFFAQSFWSPVSYILYFWYSSILQLVSALPSWYLTKFYIRIRSFPTASCPGPYADFH